MITNIQNKWRLPTIDEFENVLHPNKNKIPNLKKDSPYWSSSEYNYYFAWYFYFYSGMAYYSNKYFTIQIRPVRDFSSDSTNLPNTTIIGNLEVHNEDLGTMNYYEAVEAVNKLNETKN